MNKNFLGFIFSCMALTVLVLLVFMILFWMQVPTGRFIDWVVSLVSFWWLLVIVTFPWNMYFRAKEVLAEAAKSSERKITVKPEDVAYTSHLVGRSLRLAIILHIASACGLYLLAASGLSSVGYIGAGAALLLTGLRPAVRAYEYVIRRLSLISEEIKYPREDVLTLRNRVTDLETKTKHIETELDPQVENSWAAMQGRQLDALKDEVTRVRVALENWRVVNQSEHEQLARDAEQGIAQLTKDSEFLDHVREIIRFFKAA